LPLVIVCEFQDGARLETGADSSAVVTLAGRSGAAWGSVARPARASRDV